MKLMHMRARDLRDTVVWFGLAALLGSLVMGLLIVLGVNVLFAGLANVAATIIGGAGIVERDNRKSRRQSDAEEVARRQTDLPEPEHVLSEITLEDEDPAFEETGEILEDDLVFGTAMYCVKCRQVDHVCDCDDPELVTKDEFYGAGVS